MPKKELALRVVAQQIKRLEVQREEAIRRLEVAEQDADDYRFEIERLDQTLTELRDLNFDV